MTTTDAGPGRADGQSGSPEELFTCAVPDMECPSCAAHVEQAVLEEDGILELELKYIRFHMSEDQWRNDIGIYFQGYNPRILFFH